MHIVEIVQALIRDVVDLQKRLDSVEKRCCQCACHMTGAKDYIHQTDGFTSYGHSIPCCQCKE